MLAKKVTTDLNLLMINGSMFHRPSLSLSNGAMQHHSIGKCRVYIFVLHYAAYTLDRFVEAHVG